jgi:hypothetical protein
MSGWSHTAPDVRRRIRRVLIVGGIAVVVVLAVPVRRATLAEWTVRIVDERGIGVADLLVEESWTDFDLGERGWREGRTDTTGAVVFPPLNRWHPIGYLGILRLSRLLDVHRGHGFAGRISVPFDPRVSAQRPGIGIGDGCDNDDCTRAPLSSTLTARVH